MKGIVVALVGLIALIYLVNPTAGIIEFIPDNVPIVGNLDEATAAALLLSALRYFGFDFANLFKREEPKIDINKLFKKEEPQKESW